MPTQEQNNVDLHLFKKNLLRNFENIFVHQNSLMEISYVLKALKENSPFLRLKAKSEYAGVYELSVREPTIGNSFSSIFAPFHTGKQLPDIVEKELAKPKNALHLVSFLKICTKLEHLTEQFAYVNTESDLVNVKNITNLLDTFMKNFPSFEIFKKWVDAL